MRMQRRRECGSERKAPAPPRQAARQPKTQPPFACFGSRAEYPSCLTSPRHQREHTPSKVFTRVRGVAFWFQSQVGSYFFREVVVGIRFEPSAHGEPLSRFIPIPAFLVSQNHFHNVVAEISERCEKFWKHEKVGDRI